MFETVTDDSGRFVIDSVEAGEYRIEVNDGESAAVLIDVDVGDDETTVDAGTATLAPYAAIRGVVGESATRNPQSALFVQVYGLERLAAVNDDGSWAVTDLPAGTFTLRLTSADSSIAPVEIDSVEALPGGTVEVPVMPGWAYSKRLYLNTTASGADVSEDVYGFPLLVQLDASYFDSAQYDVNGRRYAA